MATNPLFSLRAFFEGHWICWTKFSFLWSSWCLCQNSMCMVVWFQLCAMRWLSFFELFLMIGVVKVNQSLRWRVVSAFIDSDDYTSDIPVVCPFLHFECLSLLGPMLDISNLVAVIATVTQLMGFQTSQVYFIAKNGRSYLFYVVLVCISKHVWYFCWEHACPFAVSTWTFTVWK